MRIFLLLLIPVSVLLYVGCQNEAAAVKYYTLEELETNETKFKGYNLHEGPPEGMEGPWRIVPGVNYTVKREVMVPLWRELDFDGKRWVFKDDESRFWGYRFLALANDKGESCAVMLKTENEVPDFNDLRPTGPGAPDIRYDGTSTTKPGIDRPETK